MGPSDSERLKIRHAPTWGIDFEKKKAPETQGVTYGDLERDGYQAWNSNHSSGQDAFAVSEGGRRAAVADGMGGYVDKEGTAFLSKFMADQSVVRGIDAFFDPKQMDEMYGQAEALFEARYGRKFRLPAAKGKLGGSVGTTLTFSEVLDTTETGDSTVRLVIIGDSPAYITDENWKVIKQYGEDAQTGLTDAPLGHKLGKDAQGLAFQPNKDVSVDGKTIVDTVLTLKPGQRLLIGTDYFSDTLKTRGPNPSAADFVGQSAEDFSRRVRSGGKPDDATLIAIKPGAVLPTAHPSWYR
jgi:hypothetical protein